MKSAWVALAALLASAASCSLAVQESDYVGGERADAAASPDANAGADGAADAPMNGDGAGGTGGCPSGRGPTMVLVEADGIRFCIDSTEVTRAQYIAFLDSTEVKPVTPSVCAWNTTYVPNLPGAELTLGDHPIVKVDWCDAWAFCAWAGKRLCGALGSGAAIPFAEATDPKKSEWMAACSRAGSRTYPYGLVQDPSACNVGSPDGGPLPVASKPNCAGGYDGIFDMVGNVTEWEDACEGQTEDGGGACAARGSSYAGGFDQCKGASSNSYSGTSTDWGIRCCATPK